MARAATPAERNPLGIPDDTDDRLGLGDDGPPGPGGHGSALARVTVNLNRQAVQALDAVSDRTGYSKTDAINRALQVYNLVLDLMDRGGGALSVTLDDGRIERVHIL